MKPDFDKLADAALELLQQTYEGLGLKDAKKYMPSRDEVKAALEKNFAEESGKDEKPGS